MPFYFLLLALRNLRSVGFLALACAAGCASDPVSHTGPSDVWTVTEDLRIGAAEGSDAETFGQIRSIEVDREGRILVLDYLDQQIRVFAPDGTPVSTFGSRGSGPGEFRGANGMVWGVDGNLYVNDPANNRIMVLSPNGEEVATLRRPVGSHGYEWDGGVDSAGRLFGFTPVLRGPIDMSPGLKHDARMVLVRYDPATRRTDTTDFPQRGTAYLRGARGAMTIPHAPHDLWLYDASGHVWTANTGVYQVVETTLDGDTVHVFERPTARTPLTDAERSSMMEWLDRAREQIGDFGLDASALPTERPAISDFLRDRVGRVWIQADPGDSVSVYDVFSRDGQWIARARVLMPHHRVPRPVLTTEYFYAVTADSLGVEYVVRGRIRLPGTLDGRHLVREHL